MDIANTWSNAFEDAAKCLEQFRQDPVQMKACAQFTQLLAETFRSGGNVFSAGNGGSHCDSMHFAEEWTGRYRKDRKPMGALSLGDASHMTCVGNDFGFEHIFARQLAGLGRKGDLFMGISTSGNSKNVILAVEEAKRIGMKTVGLLGRDGGQLKGLVDLSIVAQGTTTDRIQEIHIKVIHTVIESVERIIFPENYK